MNFEILDVPHDAKKSMVCAEENCTRSFSEKYSGNENSNRIKIYQTTMNVSNTVNAAKHRRNNGLPVNNGGCQDFLNI